MHGKNSVSIPVEDFLRRKHDQVRSATPASLFAVQELQHRARVSVPHSSWVDCSMRVPITAFRNCVTGNLQQPCYPAPDKASLSIGLRLPLRSK
jgi:hypothetical protein